MLRVNRLYISRIIKNRLPRPEFAQQPARPAKPRLCVFFEVFAYLAVEPAAMVVHVAALAFHKKFVPVMTFPVEPSSHVSVPEPGVSPLLATSVITTTLPTTD